MLLTSPVMLLLLAAGMLLHPIVRLPTQAVYGLTAICLAVLLFDSVFRAKARHSDTLGMRASRLGLLNLGFALVAFSFALTKLGYSLAEGVLASLVLAGPTALVAGRGAITELLDIERLLMSALTATLPFLALDILYAFGGLYGLLLPLARYLTGIGTGVVVGFITVRICSRTRNDVARTVALLVAALFAMLLAETLGGAGVLAVAALGLLAASTASKHLLALEDRVVSVVGAVAALLLGLTFGFSGAVAMTALALFAVLVGARIIAALVGGHGPFGERILLAVAPAQGPVTAAVLLALPVFGVSHSLLGVLTGIVLATLLLSSIVGLARSR